MGRLGSYLDLLRVPRGARWGLKGTEINNFENSRCHLEPPRAPQEPQRDPQEHQKGAQEKPKTQQSSPRRGDIRVFEGGRVGEYVEIRVQMGFGGFARPAASPSARLRNTCSDGLWWLHEALCLAIHALGEQFGVVEGSPRAKMGAQGCPKKSF